VVVVGLGPAGPDLLTGGARDALDRAAVRFLRTSRHPSAGAAGEATSFDEVYEAAASVVVNSAAQPDAVRARTTTPPEPQEGQLTITVPPASWHILRYVDRAA